MLALSERQYVSPREATELFGRCAAYWRGLCRARKIAHTMVDGGSKITESESDEIDQAAHELMSVAAYIAAQARAASKQNGPGRAATLASA